jgi:hypothetical protein
MFVEKFLRNDEHEYRRREQQKDFGFKIRYFSDGDIRTKEDLVLNSMDKNEITLDQMIQIVIGFFSHCVVTWNSGNFYTIVAGNHTGNINRFVSGLPSPAIPAEYTYEALPITFHARGFEPMDELRFLTAVRRTHCPAFFKPSLADVGDRASRGSCGTEV